MIDFHSYEEVKLEDVAEYGRAKQGYVYPAGTSTIQISATRGQCGFLTKSGTIHTKEVAIIPQAGINQRYFFIVIQKNMAEFLNKYATGINIQEKEIGKFPIQLHNAETQKAVVFMTQRIDDELERVSDEVETYQKLKRKMLNDMMCNSAN